MGWKKVKEHYRISHFVQVTEDGICIGSPYVHDLIVIGKNGEILKRNDGLCNDELRRYQAEMDADPARLRELVQAPDTFARSISVYTYEGGTIVEKQCETPGWPNVTHDGAMMYENAYSTDKTLVVQWAKENARAGIKWKRERTEQIRLELTKMETLLAETQASLSKLEADYPNSASSTSPTA